MVCARRARRPWRTRPTLPSSTSDRTALAGTPARPSATCTPWRRTTSSAARLDEGRAAIPDPILVICAASLSGQHVVVQNDGKARVSQPRALYLASNQVRSLARHHCSILYTLHRDDVSSGASSRHSDPRAAPPARRPWGGRAGARARTLRRGVPPPGGARCDAFLCLRAVLSIISHGSS